MLRNLLSNSCSIRNCIVCVLAVILKSMLSTDLDLLSVSVTILTNFKGLIGIIVTQNYFFQTAETVGIRTGQRKNLFQSRHVGYGSEAF